MPPVFLIVRDILLLRRGPQDLPYSTQTLAAVVALCVVMQIGVALFAHEVSLGGVLGGALLWLCFTLLTLNLLLSMRGLRSRFVQTATALLSCALVFTAISAPIALLAGDPPATPEQMTPLQLLLGAVSLPLLIWKVVVDAHVFRHSLNLPFAGGMLIAVLWIIAALLLSGFAGAPAAA
ncbi:MAG TPA: hypothetical protein VIE67_11050 [Rudaea sp.]|jgi:hypothetical protein|uniref:hypothetical protein n=1 Tax=Rudaea sp. TaxID=2136325 RepID=UPI002F946A73